MALTRWQGERTATYVRLRRAARGWIVSLIVGAMALQSLALLGSRVTRAEFGGMRSLGPAAFFEALCDADAKSDRGSLPKHHDRADCCLSRAGHDFWMLSPQRETSSSIAAYLRSTILILKILAAAPGPMGPQTGWMSSWSSRAPPLFS